LATPTSPGLFFSVLNKNLELFLNALDTKGRVHTLSTPKLLALENQEASVIIGDRIGYKVTTTINQVTTESVQFLETGVILRVTPSVDAGGRVLMKIHPEVSSGSISAGVPSKKSIEVTTQLLADSGQAILIGGLIKNTSSYKRNGVPVLGDLPGIGRLFSSDEDLSLSTETVVVITPRILETAAQSIDPVQMEKYGEAQARHLKMTEQIESLLK
jgi:type II secretory pathway component GspD/PulD (secretin)